MAEIKQEEYLVSERQRTEGYMVAVEADTYEEARAIAYQHLDEERLTPQQQRTSNIKIVVDLFPGICYHILVRRDRKEAHYGRSYYCKKQRPL